MFSGRSRHRLRGGHVQNEPKSQQVGTNRRMVGHRQRSHHSFVDNTRVLLDGMQQSSAHHLGHDIGEQQHGSESVR